MDNITKQFRNEILYKYWEEYKDRITMKQLAEIFKMPLPTVYKILRKQSK